MITSRDLHFFSVLAGASSLAAAARALDVTAPAVTQRLQALEQRLGVQLVDRSSHRYHLTAEGALLAEKGADVLDQIEGIAALLAERRNEVIGPLRVLAPLGFGRAYVAEAVTRMCRQFPTIEPSLMLSDAPIGTLDIDDWDVLIHVGPLTDSSLALRPLAPNRRILCAAPDYLTQHGMPTHPMDLPRHVCGVLREDRADASLWGFARRDDGETKTVRIRPVFTSNDGEVVRNWAVAGLCLIQRSEWAIADDLKAGRLVEVMPDWRLPNADVVALLGPRAGRAARMERFVEILKALLAPVPWRA
ncbi:LysR family transcriptional regulator [Dickeya dadantii]|uniref:LysR family transcriptional regulator n=1 Tax=Dickeya dadantii TaxID=204038 RepID=UPI001495442A|nr:LysR family transcriptional regulator [Dickeya dadantii]NPE54965.1 LysR family transcriptional regulator [Dickeya dadantii]NPE57882.1 LysR family transcriptional regulator [Dickeya dadantii]NPE67166.1 LysR family transcriptional regulator [Dickeya dadantii]NPE70254.1 LysR family transcriptional regulator [Dickeya dadantii]